MEFRDIFQQFSDRLHSLKVVFVSSSDENDQPNCSPKLLAHIIKPNKIFYIDFKTSKTCDNIGKNWKSSLAIMDDKTFTGFRLNGFSQSVDSGREFLLVREMWSHKANAYEAERMIERIKGIVSNGPREIELPKDFVIVKFTAEEAAIVKPDRVLKEIACLKPKSLEGPSLRQSGRIAQSQKKVLASAASSH
jgi:general stress protein 26